MTITRGRFRGSGGEGGYQSEVRVHHDDGDSSLRRWGGDLGPNFDMATRWTNYSAYIQSPWPCQIPAGDKLAIYFLNIKRYRGTYRNVEGSRVQFRMLEIRHLDTHQRVLACF